ncbi:MAG: gamma-glutamyltransferase [Aeromicrobium erythreum]
MPDVALSAPSEAAADAGEHVARAGGNAIDVALATSLATMVNEVGIVSLSSGGFLTVQPPGGAEPITTVDGWMDMPGRGGRSADPGSTWDVHTAYGGGVDITIGPGSVAVHGAVAAFGETHARWGSLPWREVVAPAADLARRGFRLGTASRYYLDHVHESIFGWDPASRAAVHDPADPGAVTREPIVVPHLADVLDAIAAHGAQELYTGDVGRSVSADVTARGGLLGPDDLAAYRPVLRPALETTVGPWTLGTTPPPSVGGACVAAMLALLAGDEGPDPLLRHEAVQRAVLGYRLSTLDHSDDLAADVAALLADLPAVTQPERPASTAHVSASDSDGGSCAVTVSSGYGAGMIARGTGIWLNNCLGEQELNPRGLHGTAPGTRLLSNMAPTVGRHRDGATLAIGSPGADRISTAVAQVLAGYVLGGLPLQEAVDRRRVHVHRAGRPDEDVKRETVPTMYFGGVGATVRRPLPDGSVHLEAAADPRRDGAVRVVRAPRAV